jgi:hypothetical protein
MSRKVLTVAPVSREVEAEEGGDGFEGVDAVGLAGAGGRLVDDDLAVRLDAVPEVVADVPGDEGELSGGGVAADFVVVVEAGPGGCRGGGMVSMVVPLIGRRRCDGLRWRGFGGGSGRSAATWGAVRL